MDDDNPEPAYKVARGIELEYCFDDWVKVMLIPNIRGIYYGRGVGYEVKELVPPEEIREISASKIRAGK